MSNDFFNIPTRSRIRHMLLAGNPYDAFLLEEAGFRPAPQEKVSEAPLFSHVRTGHEALQTLATIKFDLFITDYSLPDMHGCSLAETVRKLYPEIPVVVLTSNTDLGSASNEIEAPLDPNLFIWYGAPNFLRALIKLQEDEINAPILVENGHSLVILLVEDEPNFYSHFIPVLYDRIRASALELLPEDKRPSSIWSSIEHRPLVLLRRSFEEALAVLYRYRKQVMAMITDMRFPMRNDLRGDAGLRLLYRARSIEAHLPIAVASREREHERAANEANAIFLWKDSPHLLAEIDHFLINYCGFGPFVFTWPAGDRYGVARTLKELRDLIADVPDVVFEHHALHSDFSTWLSVHGYQQMAYDVREMSLIDPDPRTALLVALDQELAAQKDNSDQ